MLDSARSQGVCGAAGLVFDWLYPAHFPTILACLDAWSDVPSVSTPILKFMAEFVMNKTQRLAFDASSASGILLFREVSKVRARLHKASGSCGVGWANVALSKTTQCRLR